MTSYDLARVAELTNLQMRAEKAETERDELKARLVGIRSMIEDCYDLPTRPDSLIQMVLAEVKR